MAIYSLMDLARLTKLQSRTIRYYISEGLVPRPTTVGRTASYGDEHLETLKAIKAFKKEGCYLQDIRRKLLEPPMEPPLRSFPRKPPKTGLSSEITIRIQAGISPECWAQINHHLEAIQKLLQEPETT